MTDTKHTAAQPLDLDKLEALAREKWNAESDMHNQWVDLGQDERDDLIAQARAAQPESATLASQEDITGTTGAVQSIGPDDLADMTPQGAIVQQDGDVRRVCMTYAELKQFAQLAAKGQGEPVARMNYAFDRGIDWLVPYTTIPEGTRLYAAPASAQPDLRAQLAAKGQSAVRCVVCGSDEPRTGTCGSDDPRALCNLAAPASAQPDRGAAKAPAEQAVSVLTDEAYMNEDCDAPMVNGACYECGFGPCRRMAILAASPASTPEASPASQPVAPAGYKLVPLEPTPEMQQAGHDTPGAHGYNASYRAMVAAAPVAVAPSDAKGKADAAKLAVGVHANGTTVHVSVHLKQGDRTTVLYSQAHPDCRETAGIVSLPSHLFATSAADAKDAARAGGRIAALRVALRQISETRFGYDGDCGTTKIADDALYADEQVAATAAQQAAPGNDGAGYRMDPAYACPESGNGCDQFCINEHRTAASRQAAPVAKGEPWTKAPPTEQADYWNWDGDPDHAPMIYHVLWSGTAKKCFVSIGQYGIDEAIWCDSFGGWWLKIEQPSIPQTQSSANAAERECQYPHESAECNGCGWTDGAKGGDAVGGAS